MKKGLSYLSKDRGERALTRVSNYLTTDLPRVRGALLLCRTGGLLC